MSRRHRRAVAPRTRPEPGLVNNTLETYESANVLISDLLGSILLGMAASIAVLPMSEMLVQSRRLLHSTQVGPPGVFVEATPT